MISAISPFRPLTRREILKLLGISAGASFLSPLVAGCAKDPVTGRQEFMLITAEEEISLDRKQSPYQFSNDYGEVQDPRLNGYLHEVGSALAAKSHRPEMPFSFRAVNAAYVNAYAFPGGSIAATRGILLELDNEAELAALLGHEIGHVNARHTAESLTKGTLTGILVSGAAIAGSLAGYGSLAGDLGGIGAGALLAHYSRDNEREADSLGMEYMTRGGYTPEGMVGLMEVLLQTGKHNPGIVELMFSTHPMSKERHQMAIHESRTTYQHFRGAPAHRERYMDNTAGLRKIKNVITSLQNGQKAFGQKKYQRAEEEFHKALKTSPDDYASLVMMAKCKLARDRNREAEDYGKQAIGVYPREAQAHIVTGVATLLSNHYQGALERFSEYDRLLPGNPSILFFKGLSLEGMKSIQQAANQYRQFLQQVRKGPQARHAYTRLQEWGYL